MKIISITGGVGSGKSEVLRVLQEEFDAEIIKAMKWLTSSWSRVRKAISMW